MKWFGPKRATGIKQIPVPVGKFCYWCAELIEEKDSGVEDWEGGYAHHNCYMRQMLGPLAHIEKRCGCYIPGSTEGDPAGMTTRQAADAAFLAWSKTQTMKDLVN